MDKFIVGVGFGVAVMFFYDLFNKCFHNQGVISTKIDNLEERLEQPRVVGEVSGLSEGYV